MGFATQNGPNAPQSATFPLFQPVLSPFSPPHYCLRISTDQTLCTGSIPAISCPQCTPCNCSAPQIAPQIWMFLPLGAVGGPFALPNYHLRMSTDQTLCASFTPSCHKLSIVHPSQLCCPPNCPPNLYFINLFRSNHKSHLSYYYLFFSVVCLPLPPPQKSSMEQYFEVLDIQTLESISNQFQIDLRLCQINLKSISNQSRNDAKSVLIRSLIDLRSISDQSRIDLESISD